MRSAVRCLVAVLAVGCGNSPSTAPTPGVVSIGGRAERGLTVSVGLDANGQAVPGAAYTVTPQAAATFVPPDSLRLLQAGPLTVTGRGLARGDSVRASLAVTVAVPPTIVFEAVVSGNRDIYSVALDGGALTPLTTDAGDDRQPSASGGTVVFVSYRTGSAELFSVPLAGGSQTRLTTNSSDESDPRLSPDGTHLALIFVGAYSRVMIASASAAAPTRPIAADAGFSGALEASPAWSPAGDRVAYTTTRDGAAGIYIAALAGATGSATQLVSGAHGYASVEPAWSPDGLTIAFASNRDGPTELYRVTLATGAAVRLTTRGNVGQPSWLADGRLLFTERVAGTFALRWLDPADPARVHSIPTGAGSAQHPTAAR